MFFPKELPINVPNCLLHAAPGLSVPFVPYSDITVEEMPFLCEATSSTITFLSRTLNVIKKFSSQSDVRDIIPEDTIEVIFGSAFLLVLGGVFGRGFVGAFCLFVFFFPQYNLKLTYLDKYWNSLYICV